MMTSRIQCFLLFLVGTTAHANWPQYRGPQAQGVQTNAPLPVRWDISQEKNLRWKTPVPGLAHASPVVWEDRVYLTTAVSSGQAELKVGLYGNIESVEETAAQQWRLLCLNLHDGTVRWNKLGHEAVPRVKRHTKATHNNSTPATDGRHLVAIFGSEGLFCFDADGGLRWKRDLGPMDSGYFRSPTAQWGFASSPVIHQGTVIVQCDVQTNSFLAAFDLEDGSELWRTPRTDVPTWSTPAIHAGAQRTQIIVNGWHHTGGYDFRTGESLWWLSGGGDIPVPTPIVSADRGLVYLTSAHGRFRPMRAARLDARGDITPEDPGATNEHIAWAHPRQGNYMQTPILVGDHLWACNDNGILTCFDAATGEIQYEERLSAGQGFTASPVSDGRHVYFTSEMGEVFVVPGAPVFSVTATNQLHETVLATPAIADGSLLFRTRGHVVAVGEMR